MGALKWLFWIAAWPGLAQAGHRFGATIDIDGDPGNGCIQATAAGEMRGEWRTLAHTDQRQLLDTRLDACRDGAWEIVASTTAATPLDLGGGESGSDRIEWQAPGAIPATSRPLQIHVWSERTDGSAGDRLDHDGEPVALVLVSGVVAAGVPALGLPALLVLGGLLLVAARRRLAGMSGRLVLLTSAMALGGQLGSPAVATPPLAPTALADPANDTLDAGADLVRATAALEDGRMRLSLDVNDIEASRLPDSARVLLIGNSLTYSNDLPQVLQAIAAQAGKSLQVDAITIGGAALEDHYRNRSTLARIGSGDYDLVVLQQGPSSLPESQEHLANWTARFEGVIRASGARPALYMVWPDVTRIDFLDAVRQSYSEAAHAVNGMFIPAGEAWRAAWRADPSLRLYDADQFHPSALGSYTAALSMYCEFYGQTPVGLPPRLQREGAELLRLPPEQAQTVQQAAWEAHREHGRWGG